MNEDIQYVDEPSQMFKNIKTPENCIGQKIHHGTETTKISLEDDRSALEVLEKNSDSEIEDMENWRAITAYRDGDVVYYCEWMSMGYELEDAKGEYDNTYSVVHPEYITSSKVENLFWDN